MTVTDNDGLSATQDFTISGLTVTGDTFFQFWSDASGSMSSTLKQTAQIASVPLVKAAAVNTNIAGHTYVDVSSFGPLPNGIGRVSEAADFAYYCIVSGMEITHPRIPAGTLAILPTGGNGKKWNLETAAGTPVALTGTIAAGELITFKLTDAQKSADYANTKNLRNLLQDFYATGGTEASGNTDRATNGSDAYDSRVYWSQDSSNERQVGYLGNRGLGDTIDSNGYYPNADTVVMLAFGDESINGYDMMGVLPQQVAWGDRDIATNVRLVDDIALVRNFISTLETAAGTTTIYRSKFFQPEYNWHSSLEPIVSPNGLLAAANFTNPPVSDSFPAGEPAEPTSIPANAYSNITMLNDYTTSTPPRMFWSANLQNTPADPEQYWYDQIKDALVAMGFNV